MKQIIVRMIPGIDDVEILLNEYNENLLSVINAKSFIKIIQEYYGSYFSVDEINLNLIDSNIIHYKRKVNNHEYIYIKFDERILYPTYKNEIFKHMHPNTIFILDVYQNCIYDLKAFIFKKWNKLDTELYYYNLPNMLGSNKLCIGTINKTLEDTYYNSILKVIEGNYTANISSIKNVIKFNYEKCIPLNYTLKKIIEE